MKKIFICITIFIIGSLLEINAQNKNEDIQFSLLTCEPGTEIYSLFGHTAIRYQNLSTGEDLVYNYGMFSFNTPNFIWRFVKGETDYQLGIVPYYYFEEEYSQRNSAVYFQKLNLSIQEKYRLKFLLDENYSIMNRTYRYNYFYDNCTTRARDKIEESIEGKINYRKKADDISFRGIIHKYTKNNKWDELGIDFCLGQEADEKIDLRHQMFSPFYLFDSFKSAEIYEGDSLRNLVSDSGILIPASQKIIESSSFFSPLLCSILLLIIVALIVYAEVKRGKVFWLFDTLIFASQGIAGCIIAFLFLFSVHPTVGSNWLILLFNPIPLLYLPIMIYNDIKKKKDIYHYVNVAYLTLFIIVMILVKQEFNITILPLAICFMLCSLGHILVYRKNIK